MAGVAFDLSERLHEPRLVGGGASQSDGFDEIPMQSGVELSEFISLSSEGVSVISECLTH